MNRAVPNPHSPITAEKATQPTAKNEPNMMLKKPRRLSSIATALGFGLAYSGFTGIGGTTIRGFSGLGGALSAASDFDIGPGFGVVGASLRMLPVSFGPLAAATG